jgi:hypothetical protein
MKTDYTMHAKREENLERSVTGLMMMMTMMTIRREPL